MKSSRLSLLFLVGILLLGESRIDVAFAHIYDNIPLSILDSIMIDKTEIHSLKLVEALEFIRLKAIRNGTPQDVNALSFEYKFSPDKSFVVINQTIDNQSLRKALEQLLRSQNIKMEVLEDRIRFIDSEVKK